MRAKGQGWLTDPVFSSLSIKGTGIGERKKEGAQIGVEFLLAAFSVLH